MKHKSFEIYNLFKNIITFYKFSVTAIIMNITIIVIEAIIFCILFTIMVFKTTGKNNTTQIHNYPPEIQEEYFKIHKRVETAPLSKKVIVTKGIVVLIFGIILAFMSYIANARTFIQGFGISFILMLVVGMFDTFFLDWVLFANLKYFRLEGTEHMDKEYHQKWFHVKGMIFLGLIVAIIPSILAGIIVSLIS